MLQTVRRALGLPLAVLDSFMRGSVGPFAPWLMFPLPLLYAIWFALGEGVGGVFHGAARSRGRWWAGARSRQ